MTATPAAPADRHGNRVAREGCDRCACGCKYWENDRCIDCGAAPPPAVPAAGLTIERTEVHCHTCAHHISATRATVCAAAGHVVSVVQITVTTFNADRARVFVASPVPYLGSSR